MDKGTLIETMICFAFVASLVNSILALIAVIQTQNVRMAVENQAVLEWRKQFREWKEQYSKERRSRNE